MLQKLEEKDGESFQMKETHSSLQEEVDIKTKKLKKVQYVSELLGSAAPVAQTVRGQHEGRRLPFLQERTSKYAFY